MSHSSRAIWVFNMVLCAVVGLLSLRYLAPRQYLPDFVLREFFFTVIESNTLRNPWLAIHVAGAVTALLIGPLQFLQVVRGRAPALHRWIGRSYTLACLVGGGAALVLTVGASTGPVSVAGFGLLGVLWIFSTTRGWWFATQRAFAKHREWMIRSFALTLSAVTLRLYLAVIIVAPFVSFEDAYRAISFLCWVPNLLAAELYIRVSRYRTTATTQSARTMRSED